METQVNIPIIEDLSFVNPRIIPWTGIVVGVLLFLAFIALALLFSTRYRRYRHMVNTMRSPERMALAELAGSFKRWRLTGYLVFLGELTTTIRVYLERRFGLNAPMQTTTEISESTQAIRVLTDSDRKQLEALFHRCDRIKFGSVATLETDLKDLHEAACGFVNSTRWSRK